MCDYLLVSLIALFVGNLNFKRHFLRGVYCGSLCTNIRRMWLHWLCPRHHFISSLYGWISRLLKHIRSLRQQPTLRHRNYAHGTFFHRAESNSRQTCFKPRFFLYMCYNVLLIFRLVIIGYAIDQPWFKIVPFIWRYTIPCAIQRKIVDLWPLSLWLLWRTNHREPLLVCITLLIYRSKVASPLLVFPEELFDKRLPFLVELGVKCGPDLIGPVV